MKFGSNLVRLQVPEWTNEYINYKALKKSIKAASIDQKHGQEADLAEFFHTLDRNLEKVDNFYYKKYTEVGRRLKLLQDRYGNEASFCEVASREEIEDTLDVVFELRTQLRKLQWYGEVNRRGFVKILKKKDKKVPASKAREQYIQTRVDPRPFATNHNLIADLNSVNSWFSSLGELQAKDGVDEAYSKGSLSRSMTRDGPPLQKDVLESIEKAVTHDNANSLSLLLDESQTTCGTQSSPSQGFLQQLLQKSISCSSRECIVFLLDRLATLEQDDDINQRNCLHRFIISIARSRKQRGGGDSTGLTKHDATDSIPAAEPPNALVPTFGTGEMGNAPVLSKTDAPVQLLCFLLDNLKPVQRKALRAKDAYGRMPLHYAALYGLTLLCEIIVTHLQSWDGSGFAEHLETEQCRDDEGDSPLHLSVLEGHLETTQYLLYADQKNHKNIESCLRLGRLVNWSNSLLTAATKADNFSIVSLLVKGGADVNARDAEGEGPLHVAARFDHSESARALIAESAFGKIDLNITENAFGWTPIIVASVEGHIRVVELLAENGASVYHKDMSGWTAAEHAALRGHLDVANYLTEWTLLRDSSRRSQDGTKTADNASDSRRPSGASVSALASSKNTKSLKSFGHRYLKNESLILVSLGSMDPRKKSKPVFLDPNPFASAHATYLDTALSIVVSASDAEANDPTTIDLPVNENISTDPIAFTTNDASKVKLFFDIVPTYSGFRDSIVGRGVAILSRLKADIGSKRMNLQGDISVPIIASKTMEYIGTVNFNFLVITPFSHPNMSVSTRQTYWKSMTEPMVIGHRGMGKNMTTRKSLQLGENTLQSFVTASSLGASYVEFDVQLTKDHVPIIYHDFLVSETGVDAPVHTLTLEQFLNANETITPHGSRNQSPEGITVDRASSLEPNGRPRPKERSRSLGATDGWPTTNMSEKMKHTRDFKKKGFKGNSRGNFIQEPFTTLEEMFSKLPQDIGFNIEMKYPMLFETEEQEMDTYAVELNSFVDTVLKMVYDLGKERKIIFSSFNPDICLLLSFKQPSIPVLFLTDAGTSTVGDIRASSLQEAVRFASRWNLLGIVTAAQPLVVCPRLVRVVKESGLVCVSYGTLNNEPKNVKKQVDEGIDAVIVDSVLAIRQSLTQDAQS